MGGGMMGNPDLKLRTAEIIKDFDAGNKKPTGKSPSLKVMRTKEVCDHRGGTLELDAAKRLVTCNQCMRIIDPFDAIMVLANAERRLCDEVDYLRRVRGEQNEMSRIGCEYRQQNETAKQSRCKHTRAKPYGDGMLFCPSCQAVIPPKTITIEAKDSDGGRDDGPVED